MANEETLAALLSGAFSNRAPADLEQFGKTISQNNLYNMAAAPIMQTKFDTSTWSPTQKIASAFLQSFLGNSLAEYGRKSDAEQIAKVNQVLPQLYNDPSSVAVPEGVDRGAFEAFRATQINRKAQTEEAIRNSLGQQGIDLNPNKEAKPYKGYTSAISEILGAKTPRLDPNDPNSPTFKLKESLAKEEDSRREEISKKKSFQALSTTLAAIPLLESYAKDNTKTSDVPFIYKFVGSQDGGVVKEGETEMVAGTAPLIQKYANILNATLNGESALTPEIKQQLVEEMKKATASQWLAAQDEVSAILETGQSRGANKERMLPFRSDYVERLLNPSPIAKNKPNTNLNQLDPKDLKQSLEGILTKIQSKQPLTKEEESFLEAANSQFSKAP